MKNASLRVEKNTAQMIDNLHSKVPWIQLVWNGNFATGTVKGWAWDRENTVSYTYSGSRMTINITFWPQYGCFGQMWLPETRYKKGHKFFIKYYYENNTNNTFWGKIGNGARSYCLSTLEGHSSGVVKYIARYPADAIDVSSHPGIQFQSSQTERSGSFTIGDVMVFDLTEMYGDGNEPATAAEFEAVFPLKYYSTNFNGSTTE